jgi:hypothetical protein
MGSEYIRIGTDNGGSVEINLKKPGYKNPGNISVVISTPTGAEHKIDHPKDVSGFMKLSLAEVVQIVDKMVVDTREEARRNSKASLAGDGSSGSKRIRYLEI